MKKILWLDIEAADYKTDREGAVHQISIIKDIDGEIVSKKNYFCAPHKGDLINAPSLEVCGKKYDDIIAYPPAIEAFKSIVNELHKDKVWVVGGFNLSYDIPVFTNWWYKCAKELKKWDIKWVDYIYADPLDVRALAIDYFLDKRGEYGSFKLMDVARAIGIEVDESKAHDASYDIEVTREIYYRIKNATPKK